MVLCALALKVCKSTIITLQKISAKNEFGYQTRRTLCWFGIRWCQPTKMLVKKLYAKKYANFEYFLHLLHCNFAFNFFLQLFLKILSTKKISIYINSVFVDIPYSFFYNFVAHISTFCAKTAHFQTFCKN